MVIDVCNRSIPCNLMDNKSRQSRAEGSKDDRRYLRRWLNNLCSHGTSLLMTSSAVLLGPENTTAKPSIRKCNMCNYVLGVKCLSKCVQCEEEKDFYWKPLYGGRYPTAIRIRWDWKHTWSRYEISRMLSCMIIHKGDLSVHAIPRDPLLNFHAKLYI